MAESPSPSAAAAAGAQAQRAVEQRTAPVSALGVAVKFGTGGIGFDLATPLANRVNLRGGVSLLSTGTTFNTDGLDINGSLDLRTAAVSVDFFPFHNSFRLSPGITVYNNTHLFATVAVPGGQTFTLNDVMYTSSPNDPVHGTGSLRFGNKVAPRFTTGFGNIVPRGSKRFSFPVEAGFQYISNPTVSLSLTGSACSTEGCGSFSSDASAQSNLTAQQKLLTDALSPLRFFPIVSVGFSYKFGR